MTEFDFTGDFINVDNVSENDVVVVCSIPTAEERESPTQKIVENNVIKPKKYMVLNIPVQLNGRNKIFTPDQKTGLRFQKSWGKDVESWVGKSFSLKIEEYKAFGQTKKRVSGHPLEPTRA